MDRRTFLRAALVGGLVGCTRTTPEDAARLGGGPTPPTSPSATTPGPPPTPPMSVAPSPALEPSPSPTAAPPRERFVASRDLLGLPAPAPGGESHSIVGLMLHHTAAPTASAEQAPDRFRAHARGHRDAGFVDVAYHWGVDVAGNVYQLRDEAIAGETFTDYDPAGWLLVVCEGNFEESRPPEPMLEAVADVFAARSVALGVDPTTLVGHRDLAATACPGDHLQARLGDLVAMVQRRIADDPVLLTITDDPAALA